jgi:triosephosphate isomerase
MIFWNEQSYIAWEDPNNISKNGVYKEKDPEDIKKGIDQIRTHIPSQAVLIYGGSVNRQNANTVFNIPGVNGVLPGNASLDPQHFIDIINS